jgi:RimJ/RimL family protein N-acetyltransferase
MLLWGVANTLTQPPLFACADAAPQAELASASAVLTTARQLGSALGVAIFVAVLGTGPASGLAGFDHAWIVVVVTAALTALAGLATGGRLTHAPAAVRAGTAGTVALRDGSEVVIRQVRSSDAPLLADGFARLGPESRRLRFLRRKDELTPAELRYFTDVDHHDHEALGALDHAAGGGVGVARYVRDASDPQSAEIAVTVVDDWQGRGLGAELLAQLSGRARAAGIRRFTALVSADNAAMTALLRRLCADPVHREHGTVEWEIPLVPAAESSSDRQRAVGGHDGRGQGGGSHQVAVDGGRCAAALCERPHEQ